jgi:hypothetical protein
LKKVKLIKVNFLPEKFTPSDIPRLRQFLARRFPQYNEIHNHDSNGKFRFVYPELQFKFIDKEPMIIGYGKGFEILSEVFMKIGYFELNHRKIEVPEKSIQVYESQIGASEQFYQYKFITPWMALNQRNYEAFRQANIGKWESKLNRILWGNLRALAHGFDYWLPDPEKIEVKGDFHQHTSQFKGNTMFTFTGAFRTNFHIPDYLGLGKQVARGYGTVVKNNGN